MTTCISGSSGRIRPSGGNEVLRTPIPDPKAVEQARKWLYECGQCFGGGKGLAVQMPIRRDKAFDGLPGIVLFHAARSNCSARVRLLLAEKSLGWESRLISLQQKQNRTPEYFAINPKGLVPSLICAGSVVTESNDILYYLEAKFPTPAFLPADSAERALTDRWMTLSADIHLPGIKTLNYSRNAPSAVAPSEETERYRALQTDPDLAAFHAKVSSAGFSPGEQSQALSLVANALTTMDTTLADQHWLAGNRYGLADICWAPTIPTLRRSGFDLTPFERVRAWHERVAGRPAYAEAVTGWENTPR